MNIRGNRNLCVVAYVLFVASWVLSGSGGLMNLGPMLNYSSLDWSKSESYGRLFMFIACLLLLGLIFRLNVCPKCERPLTRILGRQKPKCQCARTADSGAEQPRE
ncbi:MAG: hypothetical protein RL088_1175 [Verrucomicrobiota bacterium]|jgi:hypothetical protein